MFNLNEATDKKTATYQQPGISDNVVVTEVLLEKSNVKQSPYLRLVTKGENGEQGTSGRMYLSTNVADGKRISAWAITARNLVDLIMATHNVDEATAKTYINDVASEQALVNKISALLVGKPFRAKFKGEEGQKGGIFATLAQVESMGVTSTKMRFNADKDIKKYTGPQDAATSTPVEELPF